VENYKKKLACANGTGGGDEGGRVKGDTNGRRSPQSEKDESLEVQRFGKGEHRLLGKRK